MSRSYSGSIAVAAALAFAAPLSAQQATAGTGAAPITVSMRAMTPGVTFAPVPAFESTFAAETVSGPFVAPVLPEMRQSQSVALMIVGGAGMIVGSLVHGDTGTIIMVGGGAVGLFGLYKYLR